MPQKLNKAGKMQDYIPAGNGDPSGEYGTSNGTNKNFTTSDKKKTEANVITENKSVVVGDKEKYKDYTGGKTPSVKGKKQTFNLKNGYTGDFFVVDELPNGWRVDENATTAPHGYVWVNNNESLFNGKRETAIMKRDNINSTKANVIDNDLSGKKERAYDGSEYKSMTKEETQSIIDKLEKAGFEKDTSYSGGRTYKIYDKNTGNWNSISFSEDGKLFGAMINRGGYDYADLDTAIDRATYKSGKAPSDKAIGWETGAYNDKVNNDYVRKHTKYDD